MATETSEPRSAPKPIPDYRRDFDLATAPDWTLLGMQEVCRLTRLSASSVEKLLAFDLFPAPGRQGPVRVWSLKQVREYCEQVVR